MMNGCICCTVRADLAVVLKKLKKTHESGKPIEAIVIETTGMADPAPVAQTFLWMTRSRRSASSMGSLPWSMRSTSCSTWTRKSRRALKMKV